MSLRGIFKKPRKKSKREIWRDAMEIRLKKYEELKAISPAKPQRWVKGQLEYWKRIISEDLEIAPKPYREDVEAFRRRLD
jgi:hypothetical protein